MSMKVITTARPKALYVLATGEFSLEEAKRTFLEVIKSIEEHRSEKIVFDGREIVGDPTLVERFYYGEFAADATRRLREEGGYLDRPQFAYVLTEPVLDPQRFGETVAVNRGMNVKAFDNLGEAIEWLGMAPEDIGVS